MRQFNKSDYEAVKGFEEHFQKAVYSRYCTGIGKEELMVIQTIYKETLNRQVNMSCGSCVLQMLTSVGRLYFNYKKENVKNEDKSKKKKRDRLSD